MDSYSRNATLDITPPAIALERRKTKEPKSSSLRSVNQDGKSASVYLGEYDCCKLQGGTLHRAEWNAKATPTAAQVETSKVMANCFRLKPNRARNAAMRLWKQKSREFAMDLVT